MKKIIDLIKLILKKIENIIVTLITGAVCALIPALVMYGVNQTSISRIEKFGAESPQGIEATNIANVINIIGGIILGIIAIGTIIAIIKGLFSKKGFQEDNHSYSSSTGYTPTINTNTNNNSNKSFDFDIKTSYVTDNFGNVIGKTQTTSYGDKYGGFEKKEIYDNFGNKQGEIDTHKW